MSAVPLRMFTLLRCVYFICLVKMNIIITVLLGEIKKLMAIAMNMTLERLRYTSLIRYIGHLTMTCYFCHCFVERGGSE